MIKPNELMLGNWVYQSEDDMTPMKVSGISVGHIDLDYDKSRGNLNMRYDCLFGISYDDIFPIPLTEEMLLKNGFDNVKGSLYASNGDFEIHIEGNLLYMAKSDGSDIAFEKPIKYVHELQNILNVAGIDFDFKI